MTRREKINRLANALTYYYDTEPKDPRARRQHLERVADRFAISRKLMIYAIQIAGGVVIKP